FARFLHQRFFRRFLIFLLPYLCGFAFRVVNSSLEDFLASVESLLLYLFFDPYNTSELTDTRIFLCILPICLGTLFQLCAQLILLRLHFSQTQLTSTGIITCYPSPTPFGLGLGPDLP